MKKDFAVEKCIVCLKPATVFTGHLVEFPYQHICAGFCGEHQDAPCPDYLGRTGCFGVYHKVFGMKEDI